MKRLIETTMLVLLLGCLVSGAVEGMRSACDESVADQFRQLERDIPSLYLINGLYLSQEQAGKLAGLLERTKKIEDRYEKKCQRAMKGKQKDFEKELDDIIGMASRRREVGREKLAGSTRGKRLRKSRRELGVLRHERYQKLDALADKACELLTESQRSIVNNFVPCFIPPRDFRNPERVGQVAGDTSFVEKALARLRMVHDDQHMDAALVRALDHLVPYAMQKRHIRYTEEAEESVRDELYVKFESAVPRIRRMDDADFELEKENIALEVLPLQTKGKPDDAGAIRWKVRRYVLNTGILDVMRARAAGIPPARTHPARAGWSVAGGEVSKGGPTRSSRNETPADIGKALRTAAILNGLDLTREQAGKMLIIVRSAVEASEKIHYEIIQAMGEALDQHSRLRSELASGQTTGEGESGANRCHYKVKQLRDDKLVKEMLECEAELDQLLTAIQIAYLSDDRRNMPKKGAGPLMRQGGEIDKTMGRARRAVSEARRMSAITFSRRKADLCREFISECIAEQGLEPGAVDVGAEVKRAGEVLERARKISQIEYSANRDELAAELCPKRSKPRSPSYGAKYVHGTPVPMLSSSSRLLFSETGCKILEKMANR